MREWVFDCWNSVMDHEKNPLSVIPDFSTRHMIMQHLKQPNINQIHLVVIMVEAPAANMNE